MAKGDDTACLLRIKLRAVLSWRPELIRVPSLSTEGLMLLLYIFFPKAASAVLPVVPRESVQYQFHWPHKKPPTFALARWQTMPDQHKWAQGKHMSPYYVSLVGFQAPLSTQHSQWEAKRFASSDQQPKVGYLCSCKTEGLLSWLLILQSHRWPCTALSRPKENSVTL